MDKSKEVKEMHKPNIILIPTTFSVLKLDISRVRGINREAEQYGVYGFDGAFIGTAFADFEGGVLRVGKNLG